MISYHTSVATNTGNTFSYSVAQRGNKHFQFSLKLERIKNQTNRETVGELVNNRYQQTVLYERKEEKENKWSGEVVDTVNTDRKT